MSEITQNGVKMWSFGYDDPFGQNGVESIHMGSATTFPLACAELLSNVEKMAVDAESYQDDWYAGIIHQIRTIVDDPAYREDPDQWEDMDFWDDNLELGFWVVRD